MNKARFIGIIKDLEYSHTLGKIVYNKAKLMVGEDVLIIKFKEDEMPPFNLNNSLIMIEGTIRTYSYRLSQNKNKVEVYIEVSFKDGFELLDNGELLNEVTLLGTICKKSNMRTTHKKEKLIDFILANNLETPSKLIPNYIPCIAWGEIATQIDALKVGNSLTIKGQLKSRVYKKLLEDNTYELRVAYEVLITDFLNESSYFGVLEDFYESQD